MDVDVTGISISHYRLGGSCQFLRSSGCGIKYRTVGCVIGVATGLIGIDDRVVRIHVLQHGEGSDTVRHRRDGTGILCDAVLIGKSVLSHRLPNDKSRTLLRYLIAEISFGIYQRHRDAHQIGFLCRRQRGGIRGSHTIGHSRAVSLGEVGQGLIRLSDDITGFERIPGGNGHRLESRTVPALHRCLSSSNSVRHHLVVIGGRNRLRGGTFRIAVGNLYTVQRGLNGGLTNGSYIRSTRLGSIRDEIQLHMSIHGIRGCNGSPLLRSHGIKCHHTAVKTEAQVIAVIQYGSNKFTVHHVNDAVYLPVNGGSDVCDVGFLRTVTHKADSSFIIHTQVTHVTVTLDSDLRTILVVAQVGLFALTANLSVGKVSVLLKGHLGTGDCIICLIDIDMQRIDERHALTNYLGILSHCNLVEVVTCDSHISGFNRVSVGSRICHDTNSSGFHNGATLDINQGGCSIRRTHLQQVAQCAGSFTFSVVDAAQRQGVTILEHSLGGHSHLSIGDGCLLVVDITQHQAVCRDGGIAGAGTLLVTVQSQLTVGVDIDAAIHGQVHITFHRGLRGTVNSKTGSHAVTVGIRNGNIRTGNVRPIGNAAVIGGSQCALVESAIHNHGTYRRIIHGQGAVPRTYIGAEHLRFRVNADLAGAGGDDGFRDDGTRRGDITGNGGDVHLGKVGIRSLNLTVGKLGTHGGQCTGTVIHHGICFGSGGGVGVRTVSVARGGHTALDDTVSQVCTLQNDGATGVFIGIREFGSPLGGHYEGFVLIRGNNGSIVLEYNIRIHVDDIRIHDDGVVNLNTGTTVDVVIAQQGVGNRNLAGHAQHHGVRECSGIHGQIILRSGFITQIAAYINDGAVHHRTELSIGLHIGHHHGTIHRVSKSLCDDALHIGNGLSGIRRVLSISNGDVTTGGHQRGIHGGIRDCHTTGCITDNGTGSQPLICQGLCGQGSSCTGSFQNTCQIFLICANEVARGIALIRHGNGRVVRNIDLTIRTDNSGGSHGRPTGDGHIGSTRGRNCDIRVGDGGGIQRTDGKTGSIIGHHHITAYGNLCILNGRTITDNKVTTGADVVRTTFRLLETLNGRSGNKCQVTVGSNLIGLHGIHIAKSGIATGNHHGAVLDTEVLVCLTVIKEYITGCRHLTGNIHITGTAVSGIGNTTTGFQHGISIHHDTVENDIAADTRLAADERNFRSLDISGNTSIRITQIQGTAKLHGINLDVRIKLGSRITASTDNGNGTAAGNNAQLHFLGSGVIHIIHRNTGNPQQALLYRRELICRAGSVQDDKLRVISNCRFTGNHLGIFQHHAGLIRRNCQFICFDSNLTGVRFCAAGSLRDRCQRITDIHTVGIHGGITCQIGDLLVVFRSNDNFGGRTIRAIHLISSRCHRNGIPLRIHRRGMQVLPGRCVIRQLNSHTIFFNETHGLVCPVIQYILHILTGRVCITCGLHQLSGELNIIIVPTKSIRRRSVVFACEGVIHESRYRNDCGNEAGAQFYWQMQFHRNYYSGMIF